MSGCRSSVSALSACVTGPWRSSTDRYPTGGRPSCNFSSNYPRCFKIELWSLMIVMRPSYDWMWILFLILHNTSYLWISKLITVFWLTHCCIDNSHWLTEYLVSMQNHCVMFIYCLLKVLSQILGIQCLLKVAM
jgi:hypothetical protein